MRSILFLCLVSAFVWLTSNSDSVLAQDDTKIEWKSAAILVLDPEGNPLPDAIVFGSGLRTRVEPGSHWVFPEKAEKGTTDAEGKVDVKYPKFLANEQEVGQVTWSVEHPEFVPFREDRSVDDDPAEIKLQRGYRIAATAIDAATKEQVKEDLYAVISGDYRDWKLYENGMLVSPVFAGIQTQLRLVKIVDGKAVAFSKMQKVESEGKSRVLLKDIELSPAVKLSGKISQDVPRPIVNGVVVARIVNASSDSNWKSRWYWGSGSRIESNGTFELEGLPSDEIVQLLAVCEGWVPENPTQEQVLPFFPAERNNGFGGLTVPMPFRVEGDRDDLELKLVFGKTIHGAVVDDAGKPLVGVEVGVWPNQYFFNSGTQILGQASSTVDNLERQRRGEEANFKRDNRFSAISDAEGKFEIVGVPPDYSLGIVAQTAGYELVEKNDCLTMPLTLSKELVTEVEIRMKKK